MREFGRISLFQNIPELSGKLPQHTIPVYVGHCEHGTVDNTFVSPRFYACTALLLHSTKTDRYGVFHISPEQVVNEHRHTREMEKLEKLRGARGIPIGGSHCIPNPELIASLEKRYDMNIAPIRMVETDQDEKHNLFFWHVVFRPREQRALVAREYFGDAVILPVNI